MDEKEIAAGVLASGTATALTLATGPAAPGIALSAAMATPVLQEMYGRVIRRFAKLIEESAADGDVAALEAHLVASPQSANLVMTVAEASSATAYPAKVEALARALRDGVLYETGTKFDVEAHIISAMCRMERLHIMVLASLQARDSRASREEIAADLPEVGIALAGIVQELAVFGLVEDGLTYEGDGAYQLNVAVLTSLGEEIIRRFREG